MTCARSTGPHNNGLCICCCHVQVDDWARVGNSSDLSRGCREFLQLDLTSLCRELSTLYAPNDEGWSAVVQCMRRRIRVDDDRVALHGRALLWIDWCGPKLLISLVLLATDGKVVAAVAVATADAATAYSAGLLVAQSFELENSKFLFLKAGFGRKISIYQGECRSELAQFLTRANATASWDDSKFETVPHMLSAALCCQIRGQEDECRGVSGQRLRHAVMNSNWDRFM